MQDSGKKLPKGKRWGCIPSEKTAQSEKPKRAPTHLIAFGE